VPTGHPGLVDRDDAVLVVVDIQEKLAAVMPERDRVAATAARLVKACGVLGIPVLLTRQYPKGLGDTVSEVLDPYEDIAGSLKAGVVDKTAFCCGSESAFVLALEATGRKQVVLAGMETHICVVQTALGLVADGYRVHVAYDAVCSRREGDHERALARMCAEGATVTTSESVIYEALGRAEGDDFKALLPIVKDA
jgi:nicotinamidase-related amidase